MPKILLSDSILQYLLDNEVPVPESLEDRAEELSELTDRLTAAITEVFRPYKMMNSDFDVYIRDTAVALVNESMKHRMSFLLETLGIARIGRK